MKEYFQNIKTSLFGAIAGLPVLIEGLSTSNWERALEGLGLLLIGIFAKDAK